MMMIWRTQIHSFRYSDYCKLSAYPRFNGETTQTALVDLSPEIESYDANGDTVTISWQWMRNGFMTDEIDSTIPANKLGAGDIWTAMVTPNDGTDDGPILSIDFSISNTAPVAVITAPDDLVTGAMVTFSAADSTDLDGAVVTAIWSIDGAVMHNGITFTTIMTNALNLEVKVIDDLGANDVTSQNYIGIAPPSARNVVAELDGSDVVITWQGRCRRLGNISQWGRDRYNNRTEV